MTDPLELIPVKQEKRLRLMKIQDLKRENPPTYMSSEDLNTIDRLKDIRQEKMENTMHAIKAVKRGEMSQRQAAMKFSVPRSTLQEKMLMKKPDELKHYVDVNRPPLTYEDERGLFRWIQSMVGLGFDIPHKSLVDSARTILMEKPKTTLAERVAFKNFWMEKFLKKWTKVGILEDEIKCSKESADLSIEHWFSTIESTLQLAGLRWLLDEGQTPKTNSRVLYIEITNFDVQLAEPVEFSTVKNLRESSGLNPGPNVTVLSTIDASGSRLPGLIVYPLKDSIPQSIIKGHNCDFSIGKSDNGNMSSKIFSGYILNILLPHLVAKRKLPAILFLKRDVDKVSYQLYKKAAKEGLTILGLYSIETIAKIKQYEFSWIFDSMKDTWKLPTDKERTNLTLFQFPSLLISTLKQKLTQEQLVHGWRSSCIFPFDHETIKIPTVKKEVKENPKNIEAETAIIAMSSLLSFLPETKIEIFEAILRGKAKPNKSDETMFAYFCHLKQQMVDSQVSNIISCLDNSSVLKASTENIKIEPGLLEDDIGIAVKMEQEEELEDVDVKVESIIS